MTDDSALIESDRMMYAALGAPLLFHVINVAYCCLPPHSLPIHYQSCRLYTLLQTYTHTHTPKAACL